MSGGPMIALILKLCLGFILLCFIASLFGSNRQLQARIAFAAAAVAFAALIAGLVMGF
jgi:hypothetical protein